MKLTNFPLLDPILSIGVALYIFAHGVTHLKEILSVFLEIAPEGLSPQGVKDRLLELEGVEDVRHIHVWSLDGQHNSATLLLVCSKDPQEVKSAARPALQELGITHSTIETEDAKYTFGDGN